MSLKGEEFSNKAPNVTIFAAPKKGVVHSLPKLLSFLRKRGWNILDVIMLEDRIKEEILDESDLVLTLGGDGTILYASRIIGNREIPILGINFGKIGLLTELTLDEFYKCAEKIERREYRVVKVRKIVAKNQKTNKDYVPVLNEYALITSRPGKVVGLKIVINDENVAAVISDGLIISTSIGSSSYALSVGGPLVHEEMEAMIVVPLAPLFRAMYPLVLPTNFTIQIEISEKWSDAFLVADGNIIDRVSRGERLLFRVSNQYAFFVRLKGTCYRLRRVIKLFDITRRFESIET